MRATLVSKPLIYRLEVIGEDFCQGDSLACSLTVENPTDQVIDAPAPCLKLVRADLKKVKSKSEGAFEQVVAEAEFPQTLQLSAKQQIKIPWVFELDRNCLISDSSQTLCFVFGSGAAPGQLGNLPFSVKPHRYIQKVLTSFESPFQFVFKGQKSVSGWVESKFKPPSARKLVLVDELLLGLRFEDDSLAFRYTFKTKSFDTSASSVNVKKDKTIVEQKLTPSEFLLTSEYLNNEIIEAKIEEALATVSTGL